MDLIDFSPQSREQTIRDLREFSRKLVRELGFMPLLKWACNRASRRAIWP
jgi:hypothetical protein